MRGLCWDRWTFSSYAEKTAEVLWDGIDECELASLSAAQAPSWTAAVQSAKDLVIE